MSLDVPAFFFYIHNTFSLTQSFKMQISAILSIALAASASATPIFQDLPTILSSISAISNALTTFDTAVKALSPESNVATATTELNSKSAAILTALKESTTKIADTTPVSLTEAIQLASKSAELSKGANAVVDALIAKKAIFDKAGQSATVLKQLQEQLEATNAFAKALVSKLPSAVSSVGNAQAKQASDALARGITAFGGKAKRDVEAAQAAETTEAEVEAEDVEDVEEVEDEEASEQEPVVEVTN